MDQQHLQGIAGAQLDRVLGFFQRVDAKSSVVLAVDTGMLAFLVSKLPPFETLRWWEIAIPSLAVALLGLSLWQVYKETFPTLSGGNRSLIYFREIAARTEAKFIEEFKGQSEPNYVNDLLGQVWRNSEILKEKFDHLKTACIFLALAIPPWVVALALFVLRTAAAKGTS
jgi:hypothetical protein